MTEHWEVLSKATAGTWALLKDLPTMEQFYLAGGTGLALQIGHRISRDLDFFTKDVFDADGLIQNLGIVGSFQLEARAEQTVVGILDETKISFLGYRYPLVEEARLLRDISVASIPDIACMKMDAISSRGTKRDFIDLFFIARTMPLREIVALFEKKYASIKYNVMHIKKSLVYFDEADPDPMPDMLEPVDWDRVKVFFREEVPKLL